MRKSNKPYLFKTVVIRKRTLRYNPAYGDERVCVCGHSYYRHFDTYDDMSPCGCKYCLCRTFKEAAIKEKGYKIRGEKTGV